ncbi:hypothetical protein NDU88_003110 [Pleurodeles waltl]|uniref:Uncharacterized protein n=1 Tax=Pleurodeles waltl TaxID=8319 RepID=A0AAV7SDK4_PLEWA|nr:hypothetical protein NDU88_003110 [Pleurodeles waltl]
MDGVDTGADSTGGDRGGRDIEQHAGTWEDLPGDIDGPTEVDGTIREHSWNARRTTKMKMDCDTSTKRTCPPGRVQDGGALGRACLSSAAPAGKTAVRPGGGTPGDHPPPRSVKYPVGFVLPGSGPELSCSRSGSGGRPRNWSEATERCGRRLGPRGGPSPGSLLSSAPGGQRALRALFGPREQRDRGEGLGPRMPERFGGRGRPCVWNLIGGWRLSSAPGGQRALRALFGPREQRDRGEGLGPRMPERFGGRGRPCVWNLIGGWRLVPPTLAPMHVAE